MSTSGIKGNMALGNAIAYFTKEGYTVSIPLTDTQEYDLVVDINGELKKVQCKYTSTREKSGNFRIDIRVRGHKNASGDYYCKIMNYNEVDYVYALTEDMDSYLIPVELFVGKQQLTLNSNHIEFKL